MARKRKPTEGLIQRGGVWCLNFTVRGQRFRQSTGCHHLADAKVVRDRERRQAELGEVQGGQEKRLGMIADRWFTAKAATLKSAETTAFRLTTMMAIAGSETDVTSLRTADVEAFVQARRMQVTRQGRPPTNATVNRDMIDTTLRPILRYAARVLELPVRAIEWSEVRLPEPKGRTRNFSKAELTAWRAALPAWHRPVFDFALRYGVRLQEAFFTLDAVDLDAGRITLRKRKNGLDHTIPLDPRDRRDLAARIGRARAAGVATPWFRERPSGNLTPVHWRGFQSASQRALKLTGIVDARPVHDLRHHAGTGMHRAKGPFVAQALLGHEDLKSTARYAHVNEADVLDGLRHSSDHEDAEPAENLKHSKG